MKLSNRILLVVSACLLLSACEGDSRPFSEAVEVRALNLTGVEITPPANSVDDIFLNINQQIQLGIVGLGESEQRPTLDASDRDWRVVDPTVAVIDGNGLVRALANGETDVVLEFGGLTSAQFTINVANETLQSIDVISGQASVERCRAQDYFAIGTFSDGTPRNLDDVRWTLPEDVNDDARVRNNPDGTATLTALNVSMLNLIATSGVATQTLAVEVADTLRSVLISPNPASVTVGSTLDMVATGRYANAAPVEGQPDNITNQVVITDNVNWSVVSGTTAASISNADGSRGQLTGISSSTVTVTANCGNQFAEEPRTVTVSSTTTSTDSSDTLSFNVTNPYNLPRTQTGGFRLRVSTGSIYDFDNDISDDVTWSFTNLETTTQPITLVESGTSGGLIRPIATGTVIVTATTDDGISNTITVEVVDS